MGEFERSPDGKGIFLDEINPTFDCVVEAQTSVLKDSPGWLYGEEDQEQMAP